MREYKFLMNNQSELSMNDLRNLLKDNEITNFDPVAEAFKVRVERDYTHTGAVTVVVAQEGGVLWEMEKARARPKPSPFLRELPNPPGYTAGNESKHK